MTEEASQQIVVDEEMKREQDYNLIGFSTVRKALENIKHPGDGLTVTAAEELAKALMNTALAEYFTENEGHYLDPDLRKYIISGATMAYVYWHSGIEVDNGKQAYE